MENLAKQLIKYFKSLGIEVYTNTKARGHQGFYLKNRIDISKNTREDRIIPTLLHEFAHFIHDKLEKDMAKTGGSLEVLFRLEQQAVEQVKVQPGIIQNLQLLLFSSKERTASQVSAVKQFASQSPCDAQSDLQPNGSLFDGAAITRLEAELSLVTQFVDENSLCPKLTLHKKQVKEKIKKQESIIKLSYPNFLRSKKFKEFDKYIKKSKARYLLSYDRVKFVSPHIFKLLRHVEILSIDNLERDFPEMPQAYCAYIRLKSQQRKQAKISRRINHLNKYYSKPTELFSRLVEGLYLDSERTKALAPLACARFFELVEQGYYFELGNVLEMLQENNQLATF